MTEWEKLGQEAMDQTIDDFYHPNVPNKLHLHDEIDKCDTAFFDFITRQTHASRKFLDKLVDAGVDPEVAVRGICKHELGHYYYYPREVAKLMFLGHIAERSFGEYADAVLAYWMDVKDNLPQILKKHRGHDVRELYRGMNALFEHDAAVPDPVKKLLEAQGINSDEVSETLKTYSVDRLLAVYYQEVSEEEMGVDMCSGEYLSDKLCELLNIDFMSSEQDELLYFNIFGSVIKEVLENLKKKMPKMKSSGKGKGQSGQGKGLGKCPGCNGDGCDECDGTGRAGGLGDILDDLMKPMMDDAPSINDFSDRQIEEGLDKIIDQWGKGRYEKIKEFVERKTGKKYDKRTPDKKSAKGIGFSSAEINFFDEHIPYYERKARNYGLYIHKKPVVVDVFNAYPEGSKTFNVGDPFRVLNPFSTGGKVFPGLTKRRELKQGQKRDKQYKVPNLTIWLDSSGSMTHPKSMSYGCLASFVLARNYWENNAHVGVINFSCDMAMLPPTREIDQVYSMICAYFGGGTVLNLDKIKEYMKMLALKGERPDVHMSTEADYKRLLERMHPEERKKFEDKNMEVSVPKALKDVYEKMDSVLVTDGGIANIEEIVSYMNSTAEMTRNAVFIVDSYSEYESWSKLNLPNTLLVPVNKPEDLMGLAIGEVKQMTPKEDKEASLFG